MVCAFLEVFEIIAGEVQERSVMVDFCSVLIVISRASYFAYSKLVTNGQYRKDDLILTLYSTPQILDDTCGNVTLFPKSCNETNGSSRCCILISISC